MADYLASQPVRSASTENETRIANSSNVIINPATETTLLTLATEATVATLATEATVATLATEATLSAVNGKLNSLGQKNMAGSVPVVLASDQSALPVTFTPASVTAVVNYSTATVAAAASSTQSFTPASTKQLKKVVASGGARMKVEIQYGVTGSETTKAVGFTSASNPTLNIEFPDGISLGTGDTIKVIRTNTDNQSQDVYSTIILN